jgi:hypothetical protein
MASFLFRSAFSSALQKELRKQHDEVDVGDAVPDAASSGGHQLT